MDRAVAGSNAVPVAGQRCPDFAAAAVAAGRDVATGGSFAPSEAMCVSLRMKLDAIS
jgi:hypothetical protein